MWNDVKSSCSKVNIDNLSVLYNANADLWNCCGGKAGKFHAVLLVDRMVRDFLKFLSSPLSPIKREKWGHPTPWLGTAVPKNPALFELRKAPIECVLNISEA